MSELVPNALHAELHVELRALIASSRQRLAGAVNAELTRLYWSVGERMRTEVLGGTRAEYGARLLDQLGQQLANEFGRGLSLATCAAWSSLPRPSQMPQLCRHCRQN